MKQMSKLPALENAITYIVKKMEDLSAKELLNMMEPNLKHLHVSGETEDNCHSLVYKARNADTITDFIGTVLSRKEVPIILEGQYSNAEELKTEIDFLNGELK